MPKVYIALSPGDEDFWPEDRARVRAFAEVVEHTEARRPADEEKLAVCRDVDGMIVGRSGGG